MKSIAVALAVARKDMRSEWRTRELVPALAQFVVLALVIANFGFQIDSRNAPAIAPGVLWMALVFAGLVAFGRAFAAEREQSSLEAMLMTPASPAAIFAGKALAAALLLVVCEAVLLPALALFFSVPLSVAVVSAVLLATVGMAELGCLVAAMVARARARAAPARADASALDSVHRRRRAGCAGSDGRWRGRREPSHRPTHRLGHTVRRAHIAHGEVRAR